MSIQTIRDSFSWYAFLIVFGLVIPMAFFVGVVIRHRQEKSQWFWDYLQQYLNS